MVDVTQKKSSFRTARASAKIELTPEILSLLSNNEIQSKKGPVFATAIIAGTMAAKKTSDLIPFCHPLPLTKCDIDICVKDELVLVQSEVATQYLTGVEMEAMTAVSVAALTIYDMCKALSHDIVIKEIRLEEKRGGKSDFGLD